MLGVGLALTLVSSGTGVIVTQQAAQAVSCFGESCDGLWPNAAGCVTDDAISVGELVVQDNVDYEQEPAYDFIGNGRIYYSRECRASWAEFYYSRWDTTKEDNYFPQFQLWSQPQYSGRRQLVTGIDPNTGETVFYSRVEGTRTFRTPMASWINSVQMCQYFNLSSLGDPDAYADNPSCTGWV